MPNYDGIVLRSRIKIDEDFLSQCHQLKFIARAGSGLENIDVNAAENKNIKCFNAPEGNRQAVAEHTLGMLLSLFNNLNKSDKEVRNGIWDREGNRGVELAGKTVGIIKNLPQSSLEFKKGHRFLVNIINTKGGNSFNYLIIIIIILLVVIAAAVFISKRK